MKRFLILIMTAFLLHMPLSHAQYNTNPTANAPADLNEVITSDVSNLVDTLQAESNSKGGMSFWTLVIVLAILIVGLMGFSLYSYKRMFVKNKKKE